MGYDLRFRKSQALLISRLILRRRPLTWGCFVMMLWGAACRRVTTSDALIVKALASLFGGIWLETGEQATSPTPISLNKQQRHWRHGVKRLTNLQAPQFVFHDVVSRDC
jgi:hypothetical protein